MSRTLFGLLFAAVVLLAVFTTGCQSSGGGGYRGSDGHVGHNH